LSLAITEKLFVKSVAETVGTDAALLEPVLPLELGAAEPPPLLPQAARMSAALPATAVRPTRLETEYKENHLARGRDKPRAWLLIALPLPAVPRGPEPAGMTIERDALTASLTSAPPC
jgi:hypothetical protein